MSEYQTKQDAIGKGARRTANLVQLDDLGRLIREKRKAERLTLAEAASQCSVSSATLWRIERQSIKPAGDDDKRLPEPDTRTVAAIASWLQIPAQRFLDQSATPVTDSIPHHAGEATPDIVEAHLRADRKLDPAAAAALGRMFRLAYEQVKQLRSPQSEHTLERNEDDL